MAANRADRPERNRAVYVISVAAELAGVHPQTLRIYERKGLVDPARTSGGSRRYSDDDIAMLRRIQELTNEGLNLGACSGCSRSRPRWHSCAGPSTRCAPRRAMRSRARTASTEETSCR